MQLIHLIAGARPNFMKVAPLHRALRERGRLDVKLVHTGQHFDPAMSDAFFADLELPRPDHHLGAAGGGGHGKETARVLEAYETLCEVQRPDFTVVVGDVNSTLAAALCCAKLGIPVGHVEAGLRSHDRSMPEEINRVVTDRVCDILWTPSPDADANLRGEGVPEAAIVRVGNVMIDTLISLQPTIARIAYAEVLRLRRPYAVATFHRPVNVDDPSQLRRIVQQLRQVAARWPVVLPLHPRTRKNLATSRIDLADIPGLHVVEPLGYKHFMSLVFDAAAVITDSGGIQEETSYLGIPCLTVRTTTERPVTLTQGTNKLVAVESIADEIASVAAGRWPKGAPIPLWDGRTASRIADSLEQRLGVGATSAA